MNPLLVTVDSRVRMPLAGVPLDAREDLLALFTYKNPDRAKAEQMRRTMPWLKLPPAAIATWKMDRGELSVPRGGMARVRGVLHERGVEYEVNDARDGGEVVDLRPSWAVTLWDFQEEIVEAAVEREQGVIRSPTGSGKSTAAIALAARLGVRTLVIVWTKALLDQWLRRLATELEIDPREIGVVQGAKRGRGSPIVVGMQQTLWKLPDADLAEYGCVIADEVHRFGARTFVDVIDRMPARYRYGFSDDERRKDRKDFLIYDEFGDVIFEVGRKELEDRGIVHDVELRIVPTEFRAPWYEELEGSERAQPAHYNRLLGELVADGPRNALIARLATEEAANGETVLVFTHRVEHAKLIRANVAASEPRVGLLIGGGTGTENDFELTRRELASGALRVGVGTYAAAGTGVDLPSVSRGIATTPIHTNRPFFGQVRGRICRIDRSAGAAKTDAALVYLWDRAIHGLTAFRNLVGWSRRAVVLVDGEWVDARKWLKEQEAKDETKQERHRSEWFPGSGGADRR